MKKRIWSLLLVLALCLSLAPTAVFAQEEHTNLAKGAAILGKSVSPPRDEESPDHALDGNRETTKWCAVSDDAWMVFHTARPIKPQGMLVYHAGNGKGESRPHNTREYALEVLKPGKISEESFLNLSLTEQMSIMSSQEFWTPAAYVNDNEISVRYSDVVLTEARSVYRFHVVRAGQDRTTRIYEIELLPNALKAESIRVPTVKLVQYERRYIHVFYTPMYFDEPFTCTVADESVAQVNADNLIFGASPGITTMTVTPVKQPELAITVPVIVTGDGDFENPFTDVKQDDWFYDAVMWAAELKVTTGVTETTFAPQQNCTRAQIVTLLWKAAGRVMYDVDLPFTDVAEDAWYHDAVAWAVQEGVTDGVSADKFAPNQTCTRAEAMAFLWKSLGKPGHETDVDFTDMDAHDWYYDAVCWAVENHVANGVGNHRFGPAEDCRRAQIVAFIYRVVNS